MRDGAAVSLVGMVGDFLGHPGFVGLSVGALRAFVGAWRWCEQYETQGRMPAAIWVSLGTRKTRATLLARGLVGVDGDGAYVRDYEGWTTFIERPHGTNDILVKMVPAGPCVPEGAPGGVPKGHLPTHQRWHENRGKVSPGCPYGSCASGQNGTCEVGQNTHVPDLAPAHARPYNSSSGVVVDLSVDLQSKSLGSSPSTHRYVTRDVRGRARGAGAEDARTVPDVPTEPDSPGPAEVLVQEYRASVGKVSPRALSELGQHIAELLQANYTADEIRAGIRLWQRRSVFPSGLPHWVDYARRNKAGIAAPLGRRGYPDAGGDDNPNPFLARIGIDGDEASVIAAKRLLGEYV